MSPAKALVALLLACLSPITGAEPQLQGGELESGRPIPAAFYTNDESSPQKPAGRMAIPLAAGATSTPVGAGHVLSKTFPDLFVVTNKNSLEQGLFLYECLGLDERGIPQFRRRLQVTHPFTNKGLLPPVGTIIEVDDVIHGFWHVEASIVAHTNYDRNTHGFTHRRELHVQGLPNPPTGLVFLPRKAGGGDLVLEIPDHKPYKPPADKDNKEEVIKQLAYMDPEYNVHDSDSHYTSRDSAGIWRGGWLHSALYSVRLKTLVDSPSNTAKRVTATDHDIQYGYCGLTALLTNVTGEPERSLIVGSVYGNLYYMRNLADNAVALRGRQPLMDKNGLVIQHLFPRSSPVMYPTPDGRQHLVVGGEGSLMFYRFYMHTPESGAVPMYYPPQPVSEVQGSLFAGKHPVPSAVDWDGDGRIDLVSGNAYGRVLFFRNVGTNRAPAWLPGQPISAAGTPIQVQPGYQALEGPAESRYGYTCPTVVDWNGDGALDIVMSDGTSKHTVFMGRSGDKPRLRAGHALYNDGLELHGPWRVKPGVAKVNGRQAYITVDDADDLHAFYRIDEYNLKDVGKVRLRTGKPIKTHFLAGGATGRIHINIVDWDLDGVVDLLLSAPRHASVPDIDLGLPSSQGYPHAVILFLRGQKQEAGKMPIFRYPEVMHFDGQPISIGLQDGSVTPVIGVGKTAGPHLLVGEESGRLVFYERSRLSCESYNRFPTSKDGKKKTVELQEGMDPLQWEEALESFGTHAEADEAEQEAEMELQEQEDIDLAADLPRMRARPKGIRPEFEPDMMGEEYEDGEGSATSQAVGGVHLMSFFGGAGCLAFGAALAKYAWPVLEAIIRPRLRRMQSKAGDRTV